MPAFNSFCIAYIQYLALHTSYWLLIVLSLGLLDNRISFTFPFHALDLCGIDHLNISFRSILVFLIMKTYEVL